MLDLRHVDCYLMVAIHNQVSVTHVELCLARVVELFALLSTDNYG